jgi:hypothetical protein
MTFANDRPSSLPAGHFRVFDGKDLGLLLDIRGGKLGFEQIMNVANDLLAECDRLKSIAPLPNECDRIAADKLLVEITHAWENRVA